MTHPVGSAAADQASVRRLFRKKTTRETEKPSREKRTRNANTATRRKGEGGRHPPPPGARHTEAKHPRDAPSADATHTHTHHAHTHTPRGHASKNSKHSPGTATAGAAKHRTPSVVHCPIGLSTFNSLRLAVCKPHSFRASRAQTRSPVLVSPLHCLSHKCLQSSLKLFHRLKPHNLCRNAVVNS